MSSVMRRPTQKRGRVGGRNNRNVIVKSENKVEVKSNERKSNERKSNGRKPRSAYVLFTKSPLSDEEELMKESGVKFMKIRADTWRSMD